MLLILFLEQVKPKFNQPNEFGKNNHNKFICLPIQREINQKLSPYYQKYSFNKTVSCMKNGNWSLLKRYHLW